MKFRRVDQRAVLGAEGRTGRFAFQAQVQTHLYCSRGSFGQGKTGMLGLNKKTARPWNKVMGGALFC